MVTKYKTNVIETLLGIDEHCSREVNWSIALISCYKREGWNEATFLKRKTVFKIIENVELIKENLMKQ